jgi:hypothetical protein
MNQQVLDYLVLKSNNDFIFKVPHPDFSKTNNLDRQENDLFDELSVLDFNHSFEVVLFKTIDNRIGIIGKEFISWNPAQPPVLSIKLTNTIKIDEIHLLNMKPAKGPGFCTISVMPESKELIFFLFPGNDRNWDFNFRKTDKLLNEIGYFFNCNKIKLIEKYNC